MIKNQQLLETGFLVVDFPLPLQVSDLLQKEKWRDLDQYFLDISNPNGLLFNFLSGYLDFKTLEHIIAIRKSPDDEDGIWHDDGSRFLGFSLSLNQNPKIIVGGKLLFKRKKLTHTEIFPPQNYGKMILFLSGIYGFEHMVSAVTQGQRIVIAGWCS